MSNLAATDITVTILSNRRTDGARHRVNAKLVFGDGALTYPSGGIPITKGKLNCPNVIESLVFYDTAASGYVWSYDVANEKIVAVQNAAVSGHTHTVAHTHDLLLKNAAVADGATTRVNAGANLLGANTGGDLTVTGSGANGGVVAATPTTSSGGSAAAGSMAQPTGVALVAQTLKCEVIGW
jgi:hypothetical protein